ncbi:MAG: YHS domain-containing protein [Proteobacteria bacterium]|nr:YHS domain-containing protein [Pseudomonadota bacterium]
MKRRVSFGVSLVLATLLTMGLASCNSSSETATSTAPVAKKADDVDKNQEAPKPETPDKAPEKQEQAVIVKTAFDEKPAIGTKVKCPVMGGEFQVNEKTEFSEYKGKHYAFCCGGCKPKFDKNPAQFLKDESSGGCCGGGDKPDCEGCPGAEHGDCGKPDCKCDKAGQGGCGKPDCKCDKAKQGGCGKPDCKCDKAKQGGCGKPDCKCDKGEQGGCGKPDCKCDKAK